MARRKRKAQSERNGVADPVTGAAVDVARIEKARRKYGLHGLPPIGGGAAGGDPARGVGDGAGLGFPIVNLSQFEAANGSDRRGWIYHPTLDTRKDLDSYSRVEMVKKSRWLQDNVGFAGRCVEGLADAIGFFMPAAATRDLAWNDPAESHFLNRVMEPAVFDRAGKLDFAEWQMSISRDNLGDGDNLTALTETRETGRAMVAYFESHQIAKREKLKVGTLPRAREKGGRYETIDGVDIDRRTGRRVAFWLLEDPSNRDSLSKRIQANDVIFSCNQKRHNRVRGITALHRAVNHLIDTTEINASVKGAIKAAAEIVWQIVNDGSQGPQMPMHPMMGNAREIEVEADGTIKASGEGTATAQKVKIEDLLGAPQALQMPGRRLDMVHDARPHPNQMEFLNHLARDIAWGVGVAPEILWMFNGESSPAVRFRMDEFRRWLAMRQRELRRAVNRFWVYFWAKEFRNGYPMPTDPEWWKVDWVPLADLTIDHGRDGKLELSRYEAGAETLTDIYRRRGLSVDQALQRRAMEIRMAEEIAADELGDKSRWREVLPGIGQPDRATVSDSSELEPRMPG